MDSFTRAEISRDQMLARGDKWDEITYAAPVDIVMSCGGRSDEDIRADIEQHLTIDALEIEIDGFTVWIHVEGTVDDVEAGAEDQEELRLTTEMMEMNYDVETIRVQSYADVMEE